MKKIKRAGLAGTWAVVAAGVCAAAGPAQADTAFGAMLGSWAGSGQIRLQDGKREAIDCRAYYTSKTDTNYGIALRCASAAYKIEIRSKLALSGDRVSGTWEERTFNASGDVAGEQNGNVVRLSVTGGGFDGDMTIQTSGRRQNVQINTRGINLKAVEVKLRRSN